MKIERGMVLAAGFGQRMRPLTLTTPKPLIPVAGRCMLDRVLDHFIAAGVESCAVNSHYLADRIAMHVALRMSQKREKLGILLSHEDQILDTGGGVLQALPVFQPDPFFVVNGDILWRDGAVPALERLAAAWNDETMDGLLLVQDAASAIGYDGPGDFDLLPTGKLKRRQGNAAPFVFTGVQVLHPRLFDGVEKGVFSLNLLYDKALAAGRLHGLLHDGEWYHIGTPDGLKLAESHLKAHLS